MPAQAIKAKDWKAAETALRAVIKEQPRQADALNLLGFTLRWQERYEESLAAYQQAFAIEPDHQGAHEYIARTYPEARPRGRRRAPSGPPAPALRRLRRGQGPGQGGGGGTQALNALASATQPDPDALWKRAIEAVGDSVWDWYVQSGVEIYSPGLSAPLRLRARRDRADPGGAGTASPTPTTASRWRATAPTTSRAAARSTATSTACCARAASTNGC